MTSTQTSSKALHAALWVAQILLAATMFWAGMMKLTQPADKLAAMWPWTVGNAGLVALTGVVDLLAGAGLILPALLRIQPRLTGLAALGVVALMIAASVLHLTRGEGSQVGVNIMFAGIAAFIAWGRLTKVPITAYR